MEWIVQVAQLLLALSLLVGLHEAGHMIAARIFGIKVEKFFIGFPPKIFGFKKGDTEYILASSREEFERVEIVDGTFVWNNVKIESIDENGEEIFYPYDLDPIVMYEMSKADSTRKTEIGLMIKQARKEMGLTQRELAEKSGTSKHYISRIENNRSGIELSTLIRIIEGGLGRRLQINIV